MHRRARQSGHPLALPKYPKPEDLAYANPREIEAEIRPTGFFRSKTKSIQGASKKIVEEFSGEVPRTMEQLLTFRASRAKPPTSSSAQPSASLRESSWTLTCMRLSGRLDLTRNTDPKKIEQDLMRVIPKDKWIVFSHQLIWHGRRVCQARKPRCMECNLETNLLLRR